MLARAEVEANQLELHHLADQTSRRIAESIQEVTRVPPAIDISVQLANEYYQEVVRKMHLAWRETGFISAQHYRNELNLKLSDDSLQDLVTRLIAMQVDEEYYGLTLPQRTEINRRKLIDNIARSAQVGPTVNARKANIAAVLTERFPFGAHVNIDNRVLLSEAVRLEHNIALTLAQETEVRVVKWTLSDHHDQQDICDQLANHEDRDVEEWLKQHNQRVDMHGVYFIEECPAPPHPNCQCILSFNLGGRYTRTRVSRSADLIRDLINRLRKRRKLH